MRSNASSRKLITACIDSNVYVSAIAFGGTPLKVVERAFNRDFLLVSSPQIMEEVRKNLLGKLGLNRSRVERFLDDVVDVSSVFVPDGNLHLIDHVKDNLVLELAIIGGCDVLVTGDKKHLLPLKNVNGITIEPPSKFLARLDLAR